MKSPIAAALFIFIASFASWLWRYKWEILIISTSLWAVWYINAHPGIQEAGRAIVTCYFLTQVFKAIRGRR